MLSGNLQKWQTSWNGSYKVTRQLLYYLRSSGTRSRKMSYILSCRPHRQTEEDEDCWCGVLKRKMISACGAKPGTYNFKRGCVWLSIGGDDRVEECLRCGRVTERDGGLWGWVSLPGPSANHFQLPRVFAHNCYKNRFDYMWFKSTFNPQCDHSRTGFQKKCDLKCYKSVNLSCSLPRF